MSLRLLSHSKNVCEMLCVGQIKVKLESSVPNWEPWERPGEALVTQNEALGGGVVCVVCKDHKHLTRGFKVYSQNVKSHSSVS